MLARLIVTTASANRSSTGTRLVLALPCYLTKYLPRTTNRFLEQVDTLVSISGPRTVVWLAAGRNRQAADEFWPLAEVHFTVEP